MYKQTSMGWQSPRLTNVTIPKTQEEFCELGYDERVWLLQQHPAVYRKFANPTPKKW